MSFFVLHNEIYAAVIFVMIIFSFFFSGAETAFLTASRMRLETIYGGVTGRAARSLALLNREKDVIGMLLIGNNIANVTATAFITYLATKAFLLNKPGLMAVTAVQTVIFLVLCEVTPKVIARAHAESFLMICAYPMTVLVAIMKPAIRFSLFFSHALKALFRMKDSERRIVRTREEIDLLFKIGEEDGVIGEDHQKYVSEILTFRELTAKEIMTPTIDIVSVESSRAVRELSEIFVLSRFSRIPVHDARVDNIIGYVFYRDLLKRRRLSRIEDVMNKARYVPSTKSVYALFTEMVDQRAPVVCVVNEFGAVVGMVTHEDIAEEVVGEIQTRDQSEEELITELGRGRYMVSGRVDIEYFSKRFNMILVKKGFETLSGFLEYKMGKIPKKGERFVHDRYAFIIEEATERSIDRVMLLRQKKKKITGPA
ncbi:MAG: HlyC/CorC family transporter [Chrysiogenales bacterium]|nr:MAG: HlyC/CorC family transporter [Chrysiogenales bacterium]